MRHSHWLYSTFLLASSCNHQTAWQTAVLWGPGNTIAPTPQPPFEESSNYHEQTPRKNTLEIDTPLPLLANQNQKAGQQREAASHHLETCQQTFVNTCKYIILSIIYFCKLFRKCIVLGRQ